VETGKLAQCATNDKRQNALASVPFSGRDNGYEFR
jgi:hypothetical protein